MLPYRQPARGAAARKASLEYLSEAVLSKAFVERILFHDLLPLRSRYIAAPKQPYCKSKYPDNILKQYNRAADAAAHEVGLDQKLRTESFISHKKELLCVFCWKLRWHCLRAL